MHHELLRIKVYREQNAAQALRLHQRRVEQQTLAAQQARDAVQRFQERRILQEQQWFAAIQGQAVQLRVIEQMNNRIAALREQQALLEGRILEEEKRLKEAHKALEEARRSHQAALRAREKFDQFVAVQQAVAHREQMIGEEAELEEIASAAHQAGQEV